MKIHRILPLASLLVLCFTHQSFAFKATPEQISEAKHIRAMGQKMGLDKITVERAMEMSSGLQQALGLTGDHAAITAEQKQAVNCYLEEMARIHYEGDISVFARFLNDQEFQQHTERTLYISCGLDELYGAYDNLR